MGKRRKSRELAVQLLYQLDLTNETDPAVHGEDFWRRHPVEPDVKAFAENLVRGTMLHHTKIDELITQYSHHWELERMAVVDRNILRLGIFELGWVTESPPKVVINEALEISKKFSTEESRQFLNGVLDRVRKELRDAGGAASPGGESHGR
jgi:N utilization substance protein B